MTDTVNRFSSRVDNYIKFRPGYPQRIINLLRNECAFTTDAVVADIGSGTGILSELFLKNGNRVYGVEPNALMRGAAEQLLQRYRQFRSIDGTAEQTGLEPSSIDFVTAGQAFHWFDWQKARSEFVRILRPEGWAVLVWNERRLDSTPFLRDYEALLVHYGTDYQQVRHENVVRSIGQFFRPAKYSFVRFDNRQKLDFEGLKGRVFSASYTPEPGHPNYHAMLKSLSDIFERHQKNGTVAFEYDSTVYYGQLAPSE